MKLTVTGRKVKITQGIEDHLNKKLEKALANINDAADVHIALAVEKHRHFAEITIKTKGFSVHSESETEDLYTAMDQAVDKIEKQLRKHKDRAKSKQIKQSVAEKEKQVGLS